VLTNILPFYENNLSTETDTAFVKPEAYTNSGAHLKKKITQNHS